MRTDNHNNPAAFITSIAKQAGLKLETEYTVGDKFPNENLYTARLIGDPIALTIKVIDRITYYTRDFKPRWSYIAIPNFIWRSLSYEQKRDIVGFHYLNEGGTAMKNLFPNYGKI